nr:hypothetical protein [Pirellulales bacterium]
MRRRFTTTAIILAAAGAALAGAPPALAQGICRDFAYGNAGFGAGYSVAVSRRECGGYCGGWGGWSRGCGLSRRCFRGPSWCGGGPGYWFGWPGFGFGGWAGSCSLFERQTVFLATPA